MEFQELIDRIEQWKQRSDQDSAASSDVQAPISDDENIDTSSSEEMIDTPTVAEEEPEGDLSELSDESDELEEDESNTSEALDEELLEEEALLEEDEVESESEESPSDEDEKES